MNFAELVTDQTFILGVSGMIGGTWRAVDWYLNHKDEKENTKIVYILRNVVIGGFAGANTVSLNTLLGTVIGLAVLPATPIVAFMYGMCGELIALTAYKTLTKYIGDKINGKKK